MTVDADLAAEPSGVPALSVPQRRGGAVLIVAFALTGAAQLITNLVLGRMLGPARFSEAGTLVATMSMAGVPVIAFQTAVTGLVARGGSPVRVTRVAVSLTAALALLLTFTAEWWAAAFAIRSTSAAAAAAWFIPATVLMASARGTALGLRRSREVGAGLVVVALVRIAAVPIGVNLGGVTGAVLAVVVSEMAGAVALRLIVAPTGDRSGRLTGGATARAVATQTSVWLLVNIDLLWARHLLTESDAGKYLVVGGTVSGLVSLGQAVAWHRSHSMTDAAPIRRVSLEAAGVVAAAGVLCAPLGAVFLPKMLGSGFEGLGLLLAVGVFAAVGMSITLTAALGSIVSGTSLVPRLATAAVVGAGTAPLFISVFGADPLMLAFAGACNAWIGVSIVASSALWRP